ncbi:MAG: YneF family protein [Bacilli bacterium]|nr:YneF family protein [Bacilli bacterium]
MSVGMFVLYLILALVGGLVGGFFAARAFFKYELKKNPPVNEKMIRAMFMQMGRKPSEAQVKAVLRNMEKNR